MASKMDKNVDPGRKCISVVLLTVESLSWLYLLFIS